MSIPNILRELMDANLVSEAVIAANTPAQSASLPKVDNAAKQRTAVPGQKQAYNPPAPPGTASTPGTGDGGPMGSGGAPGEPAADGDAKPDGEENPDDQAEESKDPFSRHLESAHHALALTEYHCRELHEMKGLQEMEEGDSDKLSAAHQVICDTRTAINEMWSRRSQKK